ncbi:MAG: hypothetical protein AB1508_15105 [Pseudomonadota bacterium]
MRAGGADRIGIETAFSPDQAGKKPDRQTVLSCFLLDNRADVARRMGAPGRRECQSQKKRAG